jgi:RNA-binding protein with serine-rich domain 1
MNPTFNVNRGIAYIMYEEIDEAERAIAKMHDAQLDGAKLQVSIVLPRRRFSQTPPLARRGPPPRERFHDDYDNRGGPPGAYRPPPMSGRGGPPRYRSRSPRGGFRGGRGGRGGRGAYGAYRPRSYSRSRSRSPRRSRSRSSYSRSQSRTPPRHGYGRRDSPPRRGGRGRGGRGGGGGEGGGGGRRSPSYSSYGSRSPRDRSMSRERR